MYCSLAFVLISAGGVAAQLGNCSNFSINGPTQAIFSYYRFYDFRNLSAAAPNSTAVGLPRAKVVKDSSWTKDWQPRTRYSVQNSTLLALNYTPSNVYMGLLPKDFPLIPDRIDPGSDPESPTDPFSTNINTQLTLKTSRPTTTTKQQLCSAIDYLEAPLTALSMRIHARVTGSPGAVKGFFTYMNDTQESDLEIITGNPSPYVHFSNQPSGKTGTTFNVSTGGSREHWTTLRVDWLPGAKGSSGGKGNSSSVWWINGTVMANTGIYVPTMASKAVLNLWSSGNAFSGLMDQGHSAFVNVQWIEMAFNSTAAPPNATGVGYKTCSFETQPGNPQ